MNYHPLGKSALSVSEIGFGCMSLSSNETESEKIINMALDGGINFFDTADLYDKGANEIVVGKALKPTGKTLLLPQKLVTNGGQMAVAGTGIQIRPICVPR